MKQVLLWLLAAAAVALGIAAFIYGGFDDSPGLQGLGALLVLGTLIWLARRRRRSRAGVGPGDDGGCGGLGEPWWLAPNPLRPARRR